jgi:hypothetical protein
VADDPREDGGSVMKLIIEVDVPLLTIEEVQQFVVTENEFDQDPKEITAVDIFVTMWTTGNIDYKVTKAELIEDGAEVVGADGNAHWLDPRCTHQLYDINRSGLYCVDLRCENFYGRHNY